MSTFHNSLNRSGSKDDTRRKPVPKMARLRPRRRFLQSEDLRLRKDDNGKLVLEPNTIHGLDTNK